MISFAAIKKSPPAFAIRILALSIILTCTYCNIYLLPGAVQKANLGLVIDMSVTFIPSDGKAYVGGVSSEAIKAGMMERDIVLNPEVNTTGYVGTPVTFLVKSPLEGAHTREVTLLRKPITTNDYISSIFAGLSPYMRVRVQTNILLGAIIIIGLLSFVAFWLGMDALMAFLFVVAISLLFSAQFDLQYILSSQVFPSTVIFLLILFPNGKLVPRWSWLLIFLPAPRLASAIILWGGRSISKVFYLSNALSPLITLIIFGIIVYLYRNSFTLIERKRLNWLILGSILIFFSRQLPMSTTMQQPNYLFNGFGHTSDLYDVTFFSLNRIVYSVSKTFHYFGATPTLIFLGFSIYRYIFIFTPIERQQTKWIIFGLILAETLLLVSYMFLAYYYNFFQIDWEQLVIKRIDNQALRFNFVTTIIDRLLFLELVVVALSFMLATFRVGLYDVDTFINRALVLSGLILTAGVIWLLTLIFIDHTLENMHGNQKAFLVIPISVFLIAVIFKPVRLWLQKLVNKYFKPEGFNFAETFLEFTPEMRTYFTLPELSKILVTKSVEQLGVDYASVFIKNRNGKLQHIDTASIKKKTPKPVIVPQALSELEKGELVVPDLSCSYSALIPLILPRSQKPDLIGALMLGTRVNGLGYSTKMKKDLRQLGEEVGKSIYVAQARKRK